ncbi:dihydrolipoamide acetyltransferase family protein [Falsarthrobacter nasiphocae]|uniref:Dihydrolipoamide acetyltransferase component of pyruvate dehydrogenase complex n=1 Tax=Falsarthrobacter nasiphocae TaxID=189863 RepID=A0AAE4C5K2_9MICC|nr:dihydrolipoamide acetyltransferase family protein [Falsarthrobacter nasiphocae]MDR6892416.1 pyruvate dehydrogenase E2 component (dihydrolipoamide acetyltransferase) [Falsarthrobacter nasiphocae]
MDQVFMLPDLGEGLTEAEVSRWLVAEGDEIVVDQPIVEVETAKAAVEVPSPFAGTVRTLHGAEGETLAVGAPLITVAPAGAEAADAPASGDGASGAVLIGYGTSGGSGSSRRRRKGRGDAAQAAAGVPVEATEPGNGAPAATHDLSLEQTAAVAAPSAGDAPRVSSPLVRRLARENGVRIAELRGTGPDGLIMRKDVEAAIEAARTGGAADGAGDEAAQPAVVGPSSQAAREAGGQQAPGERDARTGLGIVSRTPVRGVRKAVSAAMARSRRDIPEATVWVDVDATRLMRLRAQIAGDGGRAPSVLAFVSRFVVAGLAKYPELGMRVESGPGGEEIVGFEGVNLGFAAQTERGLVVPSIERAERLSAAELDTAIREMAVRAREGACSPAELTRGTITVNNYGVFGVDGSAAIINAPEAAILGLGRIIERPWVVSKGGRSVIKPRQVMELTLAFDHRICDGGTAGGFLRFVADCIENPKGVISHL